MSSTDRFQDFSAPHTSSIATAAAGGASRIPRADRPVAAVVNVFQESSAGSAWHRIELPYPASPAGRASGPHAAFPTAIVATPSATTAAAQRGSSLPPTLDWTLIAASVARPAAGISLPPPAQRLLAMAGVAEPTADGLGLMSPAINVAANWFARSAALASACLIATAFTARAAGGASSSLQVWGDFRDLPRPEPASPAAGQTGDDTVRQVRKTAACFQANWEVDAFAWPAICEQLDMATHRKLTLSGPDLRAAAEDGLNVLVVTGTRRGEGRTTVALCLAQSAIQAGMRVAIVDADLEHPDLGTQLGMIPPCSWHEAVTSGRQLADVAVSSIQDHLTLLPLCSTARDQGLTLDDPRVAPLLRELAAMHDLVIVDTGPITEGRGPQFAAGEQCPCDAAVVVRDRGRAAERSVLLAVEALREMGIRAVGIAENFA